MVPVIFVKGIVCLLYTIMDNCQICAEKLTKAKRKAISCRACDLIACSECVKRYLLSVPMEPKCMSCKHPITNVQILKLFEKSFWNKFKEAKVEHVFETERSWIPGDMSEIAYSKWRDEYNFVRMNLGTVINKYREYCELNRLINNHNKNVKNEMLKLPEPTKDKVEEVRAEYKKMQEVESLKLRELNSVKPKYHSNSDSVKQYKNTYKCSMCPNGLIDQYGKCAVCNNKTCRSCLKHHVSPHHCDPNDVASVKQMKIDTKSCPSCHVPIYRSEGCSQIWCPQCNTVFDWNTGKIQIGGWIHNPDYIRASRNGQVISRELTDARCGGYTESQVRPILNYRGFAFPRYVQGLNRLVLDHTHHTNKNKRFSFVKNNITEKEFKSHIKKSIGTIAYHRDVRTILQCGVDNLHETCLAFVNEQIDCDTAKTQLSGNMTMINELLEESSKLHGRTEFKVTDTYRVKFGKKYFD